MMRWRLFCVALWAVLLPANIVGQSRNSAQLTGTIKDLARAGIAAATVTLISLDRALQTKSDANGSFELHDVPAGAYQLDIKAPGFVRQKLSIDIQDNTPPPPLSIVLQVGYTPDMETCGPHSSITYGPLGSPHPSLAGVVHDYEGSTPVVNAEVTAKPTGTHQAAFRAKSDQTGRFTFENLPAGQYDIKTSRRGYWPEKIRQLVIPRENNVSVDTPLLQRPGIIVCQ